MASVEGSLATLELCTKLDLVSLTRRSEYQIYYHQIMSYELFKTVSTCPVQDIPVTKSLLYIDVSLYDISDSTDIHVCIGVSTYRYTYTHNIMIYTYIGRGNKVQTHYSITHIHRIS